jgi:hypothetical protein
MRSHARKSQPQKRGVLDVPVIPIFRAGAPVLSRKKLLCRGHFSVSRRRCEIKLKKPLPTGHFRPSAVYHGQDSHRFTHWRPRRWLGQKPLLAMRLGVADNSDVTLARVWSCAERDRWSSRRGGSRKHAAAGTPAISSQPRTEKRSRIRRNLARTVACEFQFRSKARFPQGVLP